MKIVATLFLALFALNAQAELKAPGTVLARECATNVSPVENTSVCYASVTEREGSYLTIGKDVWVIKGIRNAATEIEHIGFIGQRGQLEYRASMNIRVGTINSARSATGDGIVINADGQTIQASDFQIIFHTMSL
jgi:hypothetical protein